MRSSYRAAGEVYLFEPDPESGLSSEVVSSGYLASKRGAQDRPPRPAQVPLQPSLPRHGVRTRRAALPCCAGVLSRCREGASAAAEGGARRRAGGEGAALRLRGLRRLLALRDRLRLPRVAVREEPAERALRRHARRPVRGLRHRVHLVQAYERLKAYGEEESMLDGPVVVKDNALAGTSAWANTFLGRDHLAAGDGGGSGP